MHVRNGAIALMIVGCLVGAAGVVVAGFQSQLVLPTIGLGAVYVAVGVWSFDALDRGATNARALLAVATGVLGLLASLWVVVEPLGQPHWPTALLVATLTLVLAFPIGLATERRHRQVAVGLAALAVVPFLAVGWRLGTDTPPDDPAFLFYLSIPLGLALLGLALPLYLEGRAVSRAVVGTAPDPVLPRAFSTALTGVLVVATVHAFRLEGRFLLGTTAGPLSVLGNPLVVAVALVVLVAFVGAALRLGRSLSRSEAAG